MELFVYKLEQELLVLIRCSRTVWTSAVCVCWALIGRSVKEAWHRHNNAFQGTYTRQGMFSFFGKLAVFVVCLTVFPAQVQSCQ